MAKKESFLERFDPTRQRWKMVDWPFHVEGDRPKVKVRVLSQQEAEQAYLATVDYWKKTLKRTPDAKDAAFALRERAEIVFRAFSADGEPLAADVDELVTYPATVIDELHTTWVQFQNDVAAPPMTARQMDALVEHLKKNTGREILCALPSTWLISVITTLVAQLSPSIQESELG